MMDRRAHWLWWIAWLVFLAAWTAALLHPRPIQIDEGDISPDSQFYLAKALHVTAYAFCAALTAALPLRRTWRRAVLLLLGLHAIGTELAQTLVPPRSGSVRDMLLNLLGLALGALLTRRYW
jgi:VanZ family protein